MGIFDSFLNGTADLASAPTAPASPVIGEFRSPDTGALLPDIEPLGFRGYQSHYPRGFPICKLCGQPAEDHRIQQRADRPKKQKRPKPQFNSVKQNMNLPFYGIDGEGRGRYPHIYTLLAAVNENKEEKWVAEPTGLSTESCLNFILSLPRNHYIFAYAFGYDLSKILKDLDDESLYLLFRPELRVRSNRKSRGPRPILWNGYELNLQSSKFEVRRKGETTIVWDIFKFFQGKFVGALIDWKVGSEELHTRMTAMKLQRGEFENVDEEKVRNYCLEECLCMAQLARKLVKGHEDAGLKLEQFYGAGSSAAAMLKKMNIQECMIEPPDEMRGAISQAFFGGRFENSVIGEIAGPVYNHDISSAYPYQTYYLPCLLHARWRHTKSEHDLEGARQALVKYELLAKPVIEHWAPFPFRDKEGNICYPKASKGGWVWIDEFKAGRAGFPDNVRFVEAWILEETCDCHPFKDIAHYYRERCRIGKEGPGIVMKLGCNSCYGKIAQSVGNGVFNNWAWAGMITSGCRAQLLEMICSHKDRSKCLMVATDGVFTLEELTIPTPKETGTAETGKPLGGWETKVINQNVFIARPGIYFPMNPSKKQLKECKGRGVGKSVVFDNWKLISDSWREHGTLIPVEVANVTRFCGAKTSFSRRMRNGQWEYHRADGTKDASAPADYQAPMFGEWVERKVQMSFNPMPKRECVLPDGVGLKLRDGFPYESVPYKKAAPAPESVELEQMREELLEQPDLDFEEIE